MTIDYARAKKLCSDSEMRLVDDARKKNLVTFTLAQLKQKIKRAEKLRDKWKDKSRDQRRQEQRRRGSRTVSASARSQSKAALFEEVLQRFQAELAKRQDAEQRNSVERSSGGRSARSRTTTTRKRPVTSKAAKPGKPVRQADTIAEKKPEKKSQRRAKTVAKKRRVDKSGLTSRVRGHVSTRTRRSQAKSDG